MHVRNFPTPEMALNALQIGHTGVIVRVIKQNGSISEMEMVNDLEIVPSTRVVEGINLHANSIFVFRNPRHVHAFTSFLAARESHSFYLVTVSERNAVFEATDLSMKPLPPFQPIDFGLQQLEVTDDVLRLYVAQGLEAPFGFADKWHERLNEVAKAHPKGPFDVPIEVLAHLKREELSQLLEDQLPNQILVRTESWAQWLGELEVPHYRYQGPNDLGPSLYTGIWQASFESGGLVVLELFATQILVLRNAEGVFLSDHCHDLHLGANGSVLYRTSSQPWWVLTRKGSELLVSTDSNGEETEELFGPFDDVWERFPDLENRDVSLFQGDLSTELSDVYKQVASVIEPALLDLGNQEMDEDEFNRLVANVLANVPGSYRYLHPYYSDHAEMALLAVEQDACAFTLLSSALQNNLQWSIQAIYRVIDRSLLSRRDYLYRQFFSLFRFFPVQTQKHPEVLDCIIPVCPSLIAAVAPVSNPEWMRWAVKPGSGGLSVMRYASDELRSDREFMLEMAELNWTTLQDASANLLADKTFLDEAVVRYNDAPYRKDEPIELKQAVEFVFRFSTHRHLVIERMGPAQSIEEVEHWFQRINPEHAPALMAIIPDELIHSELLWLHLAEKIDPEKLMCTLPAPLMADKQFAEKLLQVRGELILACSKELREDESLLSLALKHLQGKHRWSADLKDKMRAQIAMHHQSKNRALHELVARHCGVEFIEAVWPELFDELEFMGMVVERINGNWYDLASDRLKAHPDFVDFVLEHAEWLFERMPSAIQNAPEYAELKRRLDAGELNELPF